MVNENDWDAARGDGAECRPTFHLSMAGSNNEIRRPTGWLGERPQHCRKRERTRKHYFSKSFLAFPKDRFRGILSWRIGVLGSRTPLVNLRRNVAFLAGQRHALLAGS